MKTSNFKWSYNSELSLRPDRGMSRDMLASMVKSWRKNGFTVTRKSSNGKTLFMVKTNGLLAFSEVTS